MEPGARRVIQKGGTEGNQRIGSRPPHGAGPREETSLLGFVNVVLRYRRLIIFCALAGAVLSGVAAMNQEQVYVSYSSFTVRGSRASTPMSDLAGQLGLSIGSGSTEAQSTAFYTDLVSSRAILERVTKLPYTISTPQGRVSRSLPALFGTRHRNPLVETSLTFQKLRSQVAATGTPRTGIIVMSVEARWPELAQQLSRNIVAGLDAYNLAQRRTRAAAERDFVERILADAAAALRRAEGQLSAFMQFNRAYASSPTLTMENDRLTREVRMRQQIYTATAQSFEQAKIEQVRDIPSISVLDEPELTTEPQSHDVIEKTLLGLIVGLLAGIVIAFLRERANETRSADTTAYAEYSALKRETRADLERRLTNLGRMFQRQRKA